MNNKSSILILFFSIISKISNAQTADIGNKLAENGKMNTVVVVASIILLGIFIFLFLIDRKVKRLEDEIKN
ncbi:MAG: CcmD family protein [Bacteroidota bacterium]|jgi:hypothetical protein